MTMKAEQIEPVEAERLIPRKAVEQLSGFSRASLYRMMAKNTFPKPLVIGASVRWRLSDVMAWQQSLISKA